MALLCAVTLVTPPPVAAQAGRVIVVAPDGGRSAVGTGADPFGSISAALESAQPGDSVLLHGGTYEEDVIVTVDSEATDAAVTVSAWGDGTPVLKGRLWLRRPSNWQIRDLEVTWRDDLDSGMHLVKMIGGVGWTLQDMTVRGARSFAAVLVAGLESHPSEPSAWTIADSCIRDTAVSNETNQDQLIYVNSGISSDGGTISGNTLIGAPNGSAIKLGGPRRDSGGAANVVVTGNTIADAAQGVLVAYRSHGNVIAGNRFGPIVHPYAAVRSYDLDNNSNQATDNQVFGAATFLHYRSPDGQVQDAGGNQQLDASDWTIPSGCDADPVPAPARAPAEPVVPPGRAFYGRGG